MSIVTCTEKWENRNATRDAKNVRRYHREWEVRTSSQIDGPITAGSHASIPARGDAYAISGGESDSGALCYQINPQQHADDPTLWTISVDYSSDPGDLFVTGTPDSPTVGTPNENPILRPAKYKSTTKQVPKVRQKDKNGDPYVNSAGDPFEEPPVQEVTHVIVTITKNYATFSYATQIAWANKVNNDTYLGQVAYKWKIASVDLEDATENGITFVQATITLELNPDKWVTTDILDCGYQAIDLAGKKYVIKDNANQPKATPTLLNGFGQELAAGATPVFLGFTDYDLMAFTGTLP